MAKNRYAPKPVEEVFQGMSVSNKLRIFASQTAKQTELQHAVELALGPILIKKCRVSHYQNGTLFIEAASATLATRLNYMRMDILSAVRQAGYPECIQVKISSSPDAQTRFAVKEKQTAYQTSNNSAKRQMSEQTAEHLNAIAENAPHGLKEKLQRLAKHAGKE
ncbi:DUF721 domain-containing protein [Pseudoalteromonas xiamenensis]